MCDPVTRTMVALSVGQSFMGLRGRQQGLEAQGDQVNAQARLTYAEQAAEMIARDGRAREDGYIAKLRGDAEASKARVRNSALGIRGTTGREIEADKARVTGYNVATARADQEGARGSYIASTAHTGQQVEGQIDALESQGSGMFESIVTLGAAGAQGYLAGGRVKEATGGRDGSQTLRRLASGLGTPNGG